MGANVNVTTIAEESDAFRALKLGLEEASRSGNRRGDSNGGHGNGRGNGGDDGGGGGGDDGHGGFVTVDILLDALRRMGQMQGNCILQAVEATLAAIKTESEARQNESLALAQQLTLALRVSADAVERLADHMAVLNGRIVALERHIAALASANAGAVEDEGATRP